MTTFKSDLRSPARLELAQALGCPREERRESDVVWIRERMDYYGCIEYAQEIAQGLAGAALHEFSLAYGGLPNSRDKEFVEGLATWVFERT